MSLMVGTEGGAVSAERVLDVVGHGLGAASERFVQLTTAAGYTVVAVGPNRFRLARTSRPVWTIVLAVVLFPIGLLFLLMKRTKIAEAHIAEHRSGVTIRLTGDVPSALFDQLQAELGTARPVPPRPAPTAAAEVVGAPPIDWAPTVSTPAAVVSPPAPVAPFVPSISSEAALVLPDGRSVVVGAGVVVGRSPAPDPDCPHAALFPIGDLSLSKTHVTIAPAPSGVWVVDHHSTNGTSVQTAGSVSACPAGRRVEVPIGSIIVAGDVQLRVANR